MEQILIIVARSKAEVYEQLRRSFSRRDVTTILDRRFGERRRHRDTSGTERRRRDRRVRPEVDIELASLGWSPVAVATAGAPEAATGGPALGDAGAVALSSPEKVRELLDVFQTLTQELDLTRLLQLIMHTASRLMGADRSSLFLVDHQKQELWSKVAQGLEVREIRIPIGTGIVGSVATTGETVNIEDAYQDPRFNPEVDKRTGYRTRTILCTPVRNAHGRIIAVLQVINKLAGRFAPEDEQLLGAFVGQVAIALRIAEQMDQIEQRRRVSDLLLGVMKSFSSELEVDQLLKKIMTLTSSILRADRSTLFILDRQNGQLWSRVAQGADMVEIRLPIGRGIAGTVAATGETINIPDAYRDPRFDQSVDKRTGYRTRTILCAPVRDARGEMVGVAQVLNKAGGPFTKEDEELLAALSAQAFIALDNARLFESVVYMKNYNESILQCMATGVMTVDRGGRVSSVNPAFQRMFGLGGEVESGASLSQALDADRNERFVAQLEHCATHGERHTAYDMRYALPSGDTASMNVSVLPLHDSKQQPLGMVVVAEDITHEQRLMSTLCRYVTREIAEEILKAKGQLRLGGNRQPLSVLFCDIRNFTGISERTPPEQIVSLLNDYFAAMVHEIFAEQGTLDKFIGDGLMAVFGAPISRPDDAVRAVRAALGMRRSLRRFNEEQRRQGKLTIETGIGICHGESISGNIGSEQRMEYTVIGDPVNLASRLEGLTKTSKYKILFNDTIYEQVKDHFDCAFVGEERVKGKAEAVKVYGVPDPPD
jgi:adenylate cyclase